MQQGVLVRWVSGYKPAYLHTVFCPLLKKQKSLIYFLVTQERKKVQVHKCACLYHAVLCLPVKWVQIRWQLNLGMSGSACCPLALLTCTSVRGRHRRVLQGAVGRGLLCWGSVVLWAACGVLQGFPCCPVHRQQVLCLCQRAKLSWGKEEE